MKKKLHHEITLFIFYLNKEIWLKTKWGLEMRFERWKSEWFLLVFHQELLTCTFGEFLEKYLMIKLNFNTNFE